MTEKTGLNLPSGEDPPTNEPSDAPPIPEDEFFAAFLPDDEPELLPEEGDFWIEQD